MAIKPNRQSSIGIVFFLFGPSSNVLSLIVLFVGKHYECIAYPLYVSPLKIVYCAGHASESVVARQKQKEKRLSLS